MPYPPSSRNFSSPLYSLWRLEGICPLFHDACHVDGNGARNLFHLWQTRAQVERFVFMKLRKAKSVYSCRQKKHCIYGLYRKVLRLPYNLFILPLYFTWGLIGCTGGCLSMWPAEFNSRLDSRPSPYFVSKLIWADCFPVIKYSTYNHPTRESQLERLHRLQELDLFIA